MFVKKYLPHIREFLPLKYGEEWATLGNPKSSIDVWNSLERLKKIVS
jgi:hypothetical protein